MLRLTVHVKKKNKSWDILCSKNKTMSFYFKGKIKSEDNTALGKIFIKPEYTTKQFKNQVMIHFFFTI